MSHRVLIDESFDGTRDFALFDADGNLIGRQFTNDVEPVIDANKRAQCDGTRGFSPTRELQRIASIPVAVLMEYCQVKGIPLSWALGGAGQMEVIQRILADPDYRYLRTDK
jgi:hypothetical protein